MSSEIYRHSSKLFFTLTFTHSYILKKSGKQQHEKTADVRTTATYLINHSIKTKKTVDIAGEARKIS